ncbi:MAG: zf-HC2 domain-containing protein [Armatimonadota bacterium]|nr:zf-HC2 domain-containing protein [Armatimonadota bacterium]MDR7427164.1 zf-HC2 domain-containing protein [Armatimonadota bacterium]MDR7465058.1 zf-HC2 domain-containing protein [Armatimonadota bacterium]MDR7470469.1 zf-HC2 domain-containing protein [Armatimonadota bacterium]MDR7473553.1 zf-HC2 domain-containing protein [Armatimonadota bacterium]
MPHHTERQLSAYLDREVTPEEEAAVRRHLSGCPSCQEELSRLERVRRLLAGLPERPLPESFWPELRSALGGRREPPWQSLFAGRRIRPAAALAAAAVVVLLLLVPLARGRIDRLRAAEFGLDLFVREHALAAAADPLADRAYLALLVTDANLRIVGQPRGVVQR